MIPATELNDPDPSAAPALCSRLAVAATPGISTLRHLPAFLDEFDAVCSVAEVQKGDATPHCMLRWGRKPLSRTAAAQVAAHDLEVWQLEDAFVRSSSRHAHNRATYGVLIDPVGCYYDARSPSAIEQRLQLPDAELERLCDAQALQQARQWREALVAANITKYNWCSTPDPGCIERDKRELVLVVDQTHGDLSLQYGGMDQVRFEQMLESAIEENPGARVVVRTHPDVIRGRKRGHLADSAARLGIEVHGVADNPLPWLKAARRVYVGTSQLGYEALLCERETVVFGQPFYAGWGLADERQAIPRRSRKRSVDQLFHAAHIAFARYVHPVHGTRCTLGDIIDHVRLQQQYFAENARRFHAVGFTRWKRGFIADYLKSPDGDLRFARRAPTQPPGDDQEVVVSWGYRTHPAGVVEDRSGRALWRMEDGFLRSRGLGSDFHLPASLVLDRGGLYVDPRSRSELVEKLEHEDIGPAELRRAARLRRRILAAGLSKYNLAGKGQKSTPAADKGFVLVVGQVEDDASVQHACTTVADNATLLVKVREARPEGRIIYRPHPDVSSGNRRGALPEGLAELLADAVDVDSPIGELLDRCGELHTMSSLSGFEALLRERKVVTWGQPFYAGWGLTEDHGLIVPRQRRRTLDELVWFTLIGYPRYLDLASGEFMSAEDMTALLEAAMSQGPDETLGQKTGFWRSQRMQQAINLFRGLRHAP